MSSRKGVLIGLMLLISVVVFATSVNAKSYSINENEMESVAIYGDSGDKITINLNSADKNVNLYIMEFSDYLDYEVLETSIYSIDEQNSDFEFILAESGDLLEIELISASASINLYIVDDYWDWDGDETDIDWEKKSVTSGDWTWTQPNDESWYLIMENPHDSDVDVKIRITKKVPINWEKKNIKSGSWEWAMPNDESWYLVVENRNDVTVNVDVVIGGGSILNEGSDSSCSSIIAIFSGISLIVVVGISKIKKRSI